MKIAVMMRAMDQDSGFRAYTEGLVENMLRIDRENLFILLYRSEKFFGRFSHHENAREILVTAPHKLLWDQVAVPYRAWREGADVIFNPKFSVPLVSHCPVAMGLQEPAWWTWADHYEWLDVLYTKIMLPLFCRKASHVFPMAVFNLEETKKFLRLPLEDFTVTYTCPGGHFRPVEDRKVLDDFRKRYNLPERLILGVTRVDHPGLERSTSFFPGKNPETTLRAYLLLRAEIPHQLVFAGRRVRDYFLHLGFDESDFARVAFIDFIPYEELHLLYNAAELFILPPYYDGCSTVLIEAMACGCPVVASSTGGFPEISGGAAVHADPCDPADFARKIKMILDDEDLRKELIEKVLKRASFFNWETTARLTLDGLKRAAGEKGDAPERIGTS